MLETLGSRSSDDGCDRAPLRRHQLGQMQKLFFFLSAPFGLFDAWIEPFKPFKIQQPTISKATRAEMNDDLLRNVPSCFALLSGLSVQQ